MPWTSVSTSRASAGVDPLQTAEFKLDVQPAQQNATPYFASGIVAETLVGDVETLNARPKCSRIDHGVENDRPAELPPLPVLVTFMLTWSS